MEVILKGINEVGDGWVRVSFMYKGKLYDTIALDTLDINTVIQSKIKDIEYVKNKLTK